MSQRNDNAEALETRLIVHLERLIVPRRCLDVRAQAEANRLAMEAEVAAKEAARLAAEAPESSESDSESHEDVALF